MVWSEGCTRPISLGKRCVQSMGVILFRGVLVVECLVLPAGVDVGHQQRLCCQLEPVGSSAAILRCLPGRDARQEEEGEVDMTCLTRVLHLFTILLPFPPPQNFPSPFFFLLLPSFIYHSLLSCSLPPLSKFSSLLHFLSLSLISYIAVGH